MSYFLIISFQFGIFSNFCFDVNFIFMQNIKILDNFLSQKKTSLNYALLS